MDDAHPGRRSAIAAAACFAGVAAVALAWFVLPSDETRIRRAIPAAASMTRSTWREVSVNAGRMTTGASNNRLEFFEDQCLTALLVLGPPTGEANQISTEDRGVIGSPNPADMIDELDSRSPVTVLAEGDLTRFTCEVEGGRARGVVEFEAEGLWRGSVEYRAERRALVWQITEFRLPASRMGVRLVKSGRWRFFSEGASE